MSEPLSAVGFERADVDGDRTLIIRGEIDFDDVDDLRAQLSSAMRESPSPTMVDLSEVAFIDSSGIRELVEANREAPSLGTELVLVAPSKVCCRVLEITGLID